MKISVVTAVFNNVSTIATAIDSVLAQAYESVELVVIDGGSTDGTLELLRRYGPRIDVLVSEPDKGIYDALNKGIGRCTGDVVGFLHSDDLYACTDTLSAVARAFSGDDVDAVYGDLVYVDRDTGQQLLRYWKSGRYSRLSLWTGWMPPHPSFFLRRELYRCWGGFDTRYRIAGDYDALLRYLWKHRARCAYLPQVLVKMRIGGVSNRSLSNLALKAREDALAMMRNGIPVLPAALLKPLRKLPQLWTSPPASGVLCAAFALAVALHPVSAFAYIDPNAGGVLFQLLAPVMAAAAGAWVFLRRQIASLCKRLWLAIVGRFKKR